MQTEYLKYLVRYSAGLDDASQKDKPIFIVFSLLPDATLPLAADRTDLDSIDFVDH